MWKNKTEQVMGNVRKVIILNRVGRVGPTEKKTLRR